MKPLLPLQRWWLASSPTKPHELYKLELSWNGETMRSSRTHRVGEEAFPHSSISHGNKSKGQLHQKSLFQTATGECSHSPKTEYRGWLDSFLEVGPTYTYKIHLPHILTQ